MHDLECCSVCPDEITEGHPSISIIDNDDFHNDTLTGGGAAHRCNWMFLQQAKGLARVYDQNIENQHEYIRDAKNVSQKLSEKASEMQGVTPYRTIQHGEPPICPMPPTCSASTEPQHKQSIIRAFTHADLNGDRPGATEQSVPSYNGVHDFLNADQEKSKAYFHMSLINPQQVVNDIMDKLSTIIATKRMPFAFLVEDHPVYVRITLLKADNLASILCLLLVPSIRSV